jgi:hypothetical protein
VVPSDESTFRLELRTPWGDLIIIEVPPPKPDLPVDPSPHWRVEARCAYHNCNRLYPMTERTKLFCTPECQEANKTYKRKTSTTSGGG